MNKLFSEEDVVPRTLFEARKVAGSAKFRVKHYEIVLSFKVSLFIHSWKQREVVYLFTYFFRHEWRSFSSD